MTINYQKESDPLFFESDKQDLRNVKEIGISHARSLYGNYMDMEAMSSTKAVHYLVDVDLASFNTSKGFLLSGASFNNAGLQVTAVGDINRDGYKDMIVGSGDAKNATGVVYVVYGGPSMMSIHLPTLNVSQGFYIEGANPYDHFGTSVASADINADGYDDIITSTWSPSSGSAMVYVIYGNASIESMQLSTFNSKQGFVIHRQSNDIDYGDSIAATDLNKDGYADIITRHCGYTEGKIYVIYGGDSMVSITLPDLSGDKGFIVYGVYCPVFATGDVNNDGYEDIIAVDFLLSAYVLYGGASMSSMHLSTMTADKGFKIISTYIFLGQSIAGADINNDGYDDLIIGSPSENEVYVVYGNASSSTINLSTLTNKQGIVIYGEENYNDTDVGWSVAGADVNNDGCDDVIISAQGAVYLFYGNNHMTSRSIDNVAISDGFAISGEGVDMYVGVADLNNDGYNDVVVPIGGIDSDAVYVIYGGIAPTLVPAPTFIPTVLSTVSPSYHPTIIPTSHPSIHPTASPSVSPTTYQTVHPTAGVKPTIHPTVHPTASPSLVPTTSTTINPTASVGLTIHPTISPTVFYTLNPSVHPSASSTIIPSVEPSVSPIIPPSNAPILGNTNPRPLPINSPTLEPKEQHTLVPTYSPTKSIDIKDGGTYNGTAAHEQFIIDCTSDVTISGGGGENTYIPKPHSNVRVTITDFNVSSDIINLEAFSINSFKDLNITDGSILINLENNQIMKLLQLHPKDINAYNFVFLDPSSGPTVPYTPYGAEDDVHGLSLYEIMGISLSIGAIGLAAGCGMLCYYNLHKTPLRCNNAVHPAENYDTD